MRYDCKYSNGSESCSKGNSCGFGCGSCKDFESIYEPVDWVWQDYSYLRDFPERRSKQGNLTMGTFLYEGEGLEYSFIPTEDIFQLEEALFELYDKLNYNEEALCYEVLHSSNIEGAMADIETAREIYSGRHVSRDNLFSESMIKGGFEATKYLNLIGNKITIEKMIKAWDLLVDGCCDNQSIRGEKFRTGSVQVGQHVGLNWQLLDDVMDGWVEYYNGEVLKDHPFIKAAILHFAFEFIHPFCDGNGRMGRLLMNNFLIKEGFEKIKAVSFSRSIEKNKAEYYMALSKGDNVYTDCTYFIQYILLRMVDAFKDCIKDCIKE